MRAFRSRVSCSLCDRGGGKQGSPAVCLQRWGGLRGADTEAEREAKVRPPVETLVPGAVGSPGGMSYVRNAGM